MRKITSRQMAVIRGGQVAKFSIKSDWGDLANQPATECLILDPEPLAIEQSCSYLQFWIFPTLSFHPGMMISISQRVCFRLFVKKPW